MIGCSCANPDCVANGCLNERMQRLAGRRQHFNNPPPPDQQYRPMPPNPNGCRPAVPLTEADVRRIVREEIAAAGAQGESK